MAVDATAEKWSVICLALPGTPALPGAGLDAGDLASMLGMYAMEYGEYVPAPSAAGLHPANWMASLGAKWWRCGIRMY